MKNQIVKSLSITLAIIAVFSVLSISFTATAANYTTNYRQYDTPENSGDYAYWNGSKVVRSSTTNVNEVKWMQAALNYCIANKGLSASKLDVDGSFGKATKATTTAFQKKYNLSADGKFGPGTIKKMKDVLNTTNPNSVSANTSNNSKITTYKLVWPVKDVTTISGMYGKDGGSTHYRPLNTTNQRIHSGIDISAKGCAGKSILAVADGEVLFQDYTGARGNYVIIYHKNYNISSLYEHLNKVYVKKGDFVSASKVIGTLGKTGAASYKYTDHLHFGLMYGKATSVDYDIWKVGQSTKSFSPDARYNKSVVYSK